MRFTSTITVLGLFAAGSLALPQPQTAQYSDSTSATAVPSVSGTDMPTPPSGAPTPPTPPGNGTAGADNSTLPLCGPPATLMNGTDGGNGTMPMPPINATVPMMLNGTLTGNITMINATMPMNGTCMPPPPPPGNGTGPAGGPPSPPAGGPAASAPTDSPTASATDSAPTSSSSG